MSSQVRTFLSSFHRFLRNQTAAVAPLFTVFGFLLTVYIPYLGSQIQTQIGKAQIEVKKLEISAQVLRDLDNNSQDPRASIALLGALGPTAVPSIIAVLETVTSQIEPALKETPWPLPDHLVAPRCSGDPLFSEGALIKSAPDLASAWRVWRAGIQTLRALGDNAVREIERMMKRTPSTRRRGFLLRILLELTPNLKEHSWLRDALIEILHDPTADALLRGNAVTLLAYGQETRIKVINGFSLDLSCRNLPQMELIGVGDGRQRPAHNSELILKRTDFSEASILMNIRFTRVTFYDTKLNGATILDSRFAGPSVGKVNQPTDRAVSMTSTVLKGVEFENLDLPGATFTHAQLLDVAFKNCSMAESKFDHAHFGKVVFKGGSAPGSFFQQVIIDRLVFADVQLPGIRFTPLRGRGEGSSDEVDRNWWGGADEARGYFGVLVPGEPSKETLLNLFVGGFFQNLPHEGQLHEPWPTWLQKLCMSGESNAGSVACSGT